MRERDPNGKENNAAFLRAQSEPLAALIAVATVCLVVSLYVATFSDVTAQSGSERQLAEPTADSVWQDIRTESVFGAETELTETVERSSLPEGYAVAAEVTTVHDDGTIKRVGDARFDASGIPKAVTPPEDTETHSRPISVRVQPGDVRPGKLVVEVWE